MIINTNLVGADNVMRMRFTTYTYETDPHYQARVSFYFGVVQDIAAVHGDHHRDFVLLQSVLGQSLRRGDAEGDAGGCCGSHLRCRL